MVGRLGGDGRTYLCTYLLTHLSIYLPLRPQPLTVQDLCLPLRHRIHPHTHTHTHTCTMSISPPIDHPKSYSIRSLTLPLPSSHRHRPSSPSITRKPPAHLLPTLDGVVSHTPCTTSTGPIIITQGPTNISRILHARNDPRLPDRVVARPGNGEMSGMGSGVCMHQGRVDTFQNVGKKLSWLRWVNDRGGCSILWR